VSVVLLTYNHERYLARALDSILMQRTNFAFEVLISEDCSTDRTREIVLSYRERHPSRIRLFLSEKNLNTNRVTTRALEAACGDYIALIDGDDYWISRDKLQRQVDFLEAHRECCLCFHDIIVVDETDTVLLERNAPPELPQFSGMQDIIRHNFIPGCSSMLRRAAIAPLPDWFELAEYGDWPLYILAARSGTIGFIADVLGAYRQHRNGYWTSQSTRERLTGCLRFLKLLENSLDRKYKPLIEESRAFHRQNYLLWFAGQGDLSAAIAQGYSIVREGGMSRLPHLAMQILKRLVGRTSKFKAHSG
jgi:glycosyltransferase involved in cell wall biosynthesis